MSSRSTWRNNALSRHKRSVENSTTQHHNFLISGFACKIRDLPARLSELLTVSQEKRKSIIHELTDFIPDGQNQDYEGTELWELNKVQRDPEWTETRRLFRSVVESADLLGWICEPDGYCIFLSQAWYSFTGATDGHGIAWLNAVHPDDRVRTRQAFFDANDRQLEYKVDYRIERPDGSYSLAQAHGVPSFSGGRFCGMMGVTSTMQEFTAQAAFVSTVEPPQKRKVLTGREREVLELFACGYTVETAAVRLGIAEATVNHHVGAATRKLGAMNRTHAVVRAIRLNELDLPSELA